MKTKNDRHRCRWLLFLVGVLLPAAVLHGQDRTWSWNESVAPLEVAAFAATQSEGSWHKIDERDFRALLEGLVQQVFEQLDAPGNAALETALRQRLLHYTPELESYWPAYAQEGELRILRWPVLAQFSREGGDRWSLAFQLGRPQDDARTLRVSYVGDWLETLSLSRQRDLNGALPETRTLVLMQGLPASAALFENDRWDEPAFVFEAGHALPLVDALPSLAQSAQQDLAPLLAYDRYDHLPDSMLVFDPSEVPLVFQTLRGLVKLSQAQLQGREQPAEIERMLRHYFLEFAPWAPLNAVDQAHLYTSAYELVSIRRVQSGAPQERVYHLTIGNLNRRVLDVALTQGSDQAWRLQSLELSFSFPYNGEVWTEFRRFSFAQSDAQSATLENWVVDAAGAVVTDPAARVLLTY